MELGEIVFLPIAFDWNKWNIGKNFIKHKVAWYGCEEIFFNKPIVETIHLQETDREQRFYALGVSDKQRKLAVIFTIRRNRIRIISAKDMSRKERRAYDERI